MFFHVNKHSGPVAQLVEHSTLNRNVVGSNPTRSTTFPVIRDYITKETFDCQKFLSYFGDMLKSEIAQTGSKHPTLRFFYVFVSVFCVADTPPNTSY